jgi:hypothetical protein
MFHQVLDDIYSKIVQPLQADVYVVSSDELWVGVLFLSASPILNLIGHFHFLWQLSLAPDYSQRKDDKSFPETIESENWLMKQCVAFWLLNSKS